MYSTYQNNFFDSINNNNILVHSQIHIKTDGNELMMELNHTRAKLNYNMESNFKNYQKRKQES